MASQTRTPLKPSAPVQAAQKTAAVLPALVAIVLGVFILLGVGFAQPDTLHNSAHDTRHAFAFPCH
ncbi:MAG: CbtB domain-containing protein [Alphaproteobacteria bacterium]